MADDLPMVFCEWDKHENLVWRVEVERLASSLGPWYRDWLASRPHQARTRKVLVRPNGLWRANEPVTVIDSHDRRLAVWVQASKTSLKRLTGIDCDQVFGKGSDLPPDLDHCCITCDDVQGDEGQLPFLQCRDWWIERNWMHFGRGNCGNGLWSQRHRDLVSLGAIGEKESASMQRDTWEQNKVREAEEAQRREDARQEGIAQKQKEEKARRKEQARQAEQVYQQGYTQLPGKTTSQEMHWKSYHTWKVTCDKALLNKQTLLAIPQPPHLSCPEISCASRMEDNVLKTCHHSFERFVRASGQFRRDFLRAEVVKWAPDKFSRCPEVVREDIKKVAEELFKMYRKMEEES